MPSVQLSPLPHGPSYASVGAGPPIPPQSMVEMQAWVSSQMNPASQSFAVSQVSGRQNGPPWHVEPIDPAGQSVGSGGTASAAAVLANDKLRNTNVAKRRRVLTSGSLSLCEPAHWQPHARSTMFGLVRLLLNILWIVFGGGFVIFLEYLIGGLLLCLTVVGIPFGVQCWKIAELGLLPFGKDIEHDRESAGGGCLGTGMNVLWFFVAGIWIFLSHVALGLANAVTIIGIPFALQHLKLAMLALFPFGKRIEKL